MKYTRAESELVVFFKEHKNDGSLYDYVGVAYDIRGMSAINDQFGMEAGTLIMRAHAEGLEKVIGESGMVVRRGGDTYMAMFVQSRTDDVNDYLRSTEIVCKDGAYRRTVSCHAGYYRITDQCEDFRDLSDILDEALRLGRTQSGKKMYMICGDEVLHKVMDARMIASMFREAISNEEFLVFYQPKVETSSYSMKGAEALCRWKHEDELIMPGRFIPVYEKNGNICELDFYMLEHVCRDIRRWLDEGRTVVRTSINLSREHMGDLSLVDRIVEIIDRHNVPHEYIEIELTETSTEVDYMELKDIVERLHEVGIHNSVDDFGVGYSSMNLLIEFPWDMVKIDRSFVPTGQNDEEDRKRLIMLRAIVSMAEQLDIECIAEGVETVEQVLLLKENGCRFIQGFYFDRPLPVKDFESRLDELAEGVA